MIKWKPKQTSKHKKISEIKKKTNPNFISHSSPSYVFKENKGAWMRLVISYLRKTRAASRITSSSAMYINGDIRSRTKKTPWKHNTHKGERDMGSDKTYSAMVRVCPD